MVFKIGLSKLPGTKAVIAEDGTRALAFHWYEESLLKQRKKLELNVQGVDTVDDEDFLLISEETSIDMPEGLPLEDLDTVSNDVFESIFSSKKDKPFDLPYNELIDPDSRDSLPEDENIEEPMVPKMSSDELQSSFTMDHFNTLLGNIANDANPDFTGRGSSLDTQPTKQVETPRDPPADPIDYDSQDFVPYIPQIDLDNQRSRADVAPQEPEAVAKEAELEQREREGESPGETDVSQIEYPGESETVVQEADVGQEEDSETIVDIGRNSKSEDSAATSEMTETDVPQISEPEVTEVDVPDYITHTSAGGVNSELIDDLSVLERIPVYDFWNKDNIDHTFHDGKLSRKYMRTLLH